ncbi:MAG: hypothetical protein NZ529_10600 [Cytophagaceae bacterium]|nr:hypothetical protein [Cytophagaceae bacterium]MDW8457236.1 hypothetical protein [Cytophagaceae bacterium]
MYAQTGVFVDFSTNSTAGWQGTNPAQFVLAGISQTLRINCSSTGYENLEFSFPSINISANPVVSLKVQAPSSFTLRVDLKDINGRYTNANPVQQTVTASAGFVTYTFNFSGRFNQTYPTSATVDPTKIIAATFFFNPGSGYTNTVYFDDVTVGDPIPLIPCREKF